MAAAEKRAAKGQLYDRLFIRHWDTWKDGRRSHLFVVPVAGGEPVDLTRGMDADVPSKPFGGAEELTFSPDGRTVVFSARDAGREEPWSTDFDLYEAPADGSAGSAKPRNLTDANPGLGHPPGLLAGRQGARLPRHVAAGLRGRPLPHPAAGPRDRARA